MRKRLAVLMVAALISIVAIKAIVAPSKLVATEAVYDVRVAHPAMKNFPAELVPLP
jgi:hypothetical protein